MRWLVVLSAVLAAGCNCDRGPCGGLPLFTFPSVDLPFAEAETPYEGRVKVGWGCAEQQPIEFVGATLVDENNLEVPATYTPVTTSFDVTVTVAFTPHSAGPFHLAARFQPNVGQLQGDIFIVSPAAPRAVVDELTMPSYVDCFRAGLFPDRALVCEGHDPSKLSYVRDGQVTDLSSANGAVIGWARRGSALWTLGSGLTRWASTDAGLVDTASTSAVMRFSEVAVATDEACYGSFAPGSGTPSLLTRWVADGGQLSRQTLRSFTASDGGVLESTRIAALTADGTAWWASTGIEACLVALDAGRSDRCFGISGFSARAEAGGFWFISGGGGLNLIAEDGTVRSAAFPAAYTKFALPVLWREAERPTEMILAVPDDGGLHYERIPGKYASAWVDGENLLLFSGDGKVTVMRR